MFKIIAGDFPESATFTCYFNKPTLVWGFGKNKKFDLMGQVKTVEIVTEESKKKFLSTAGMGLVGAVALGPLGLLAGVLSGGNKKEIVITCYLHDGRKFMAAVDPDTHKKFVALAF